MRYSSEAISLLRAVLAGDCASDPAARKHLEEAARLGVDPLDYCAHRFGLGTQLVWSRAAAWAGFPFAAAPPKGGPELERVACLDRLGEIRSFRRHVLGAEITFTAPRFEQVVGLRGSRRPELLGRIRITPPDAIAEAMGRAASTQLIDEARQRTTRIWSRAAAAQDLPWETRAAFVLLLAVLVLGVFVSGVMWRPALLPIAAVLLVPSGVLRLIAALPSKEAAEPPPLGEAELPLYSVLIPLRDEAAMVPMLARAMGAIDYPSERLEVIFVVEAKSPDTVDAVRRILDDPRFRLVVVPEGPPNTKPKALNYALPLARGHLVVVYDAEDVPEPDQLRRAAARFAADPELACLQAELMPENGHETALTALFAGEYAGLFGRFLPAMARWRLPMPLGGTSNHFRMEVLRALGGWDAFNVTEDADLGVRLARRRLRVETFSSTTLEEAPLRLRGWMAQRTRWMKGWMQTFVVHNRTPRTLLRDIGWRGFAAFQVLVGGMIVSSLLHTVMVLTLGWRLLIEGPTAFVPSDVWDWMAVGILITGYGGAFAIVVSGLVRRRAYHLLPAQLLLPIYWMLHSLAAGRAAVQLIRKPVFWAKTQHGLTRLPRLHALEPLAPRRRRVPVFTRSG